MIGLLIDDVTLFKKERKERMGAGASRYTRKRFREPSGTDRNRVIQLRARFHDGCETAMAFLASINIRRTVATHPACFVCGSLLPYRVPLLGFPLEDL